jgi:hypothetical protein
VNIPDGGTRQIMIFCWWMACLCDAYSSAYYRRKPDLCVVGPDGARGGVR